MSNVYLSEDAGDFSAKLRLETDGGQLEHNYDNKILMEPGCKAFD